MSANSLFITITNLVRILQVDSEIERNRQPHLSARGEPHTTPLLPRAGWSRRQETDNALMTPRQVYINPRPETYSVLSEFKMCVLYGEKNFEDPGHPAPCCRSTVDLYSDNVFGALRQWTLKEMTLAKLVLQID